MNEKLIKNEHWENEIWGMWEEIDKQYDNINFLDVIWEMSLTAFDKPREIQVVVDNNNMLFMNFGTPGFVDFMGKEDALVNELAKPLTLPIKCWIHTHPFGSAYFSHTDWTTIRTWMPLMNSAIVLGDNERMLWEKGNETHTIFFKNYDIPQLNSAQLTLDDFTIDETQITDELVKDLEELEKEYLYAVTAGDNDALTIINSQLYNLKLKLKKLGEE
mgnify:FL=1